MLPSLLTTGLLLGVDSFLVCFAVAALLERSAERRRLALAFGICDGLASLIGSVVGVDRLRSALDWSEWLGPAAVAGYGLYVLYVAWRCRRLAKDTDTTGRLVFVLPICLSLDNLVIGAGSGASAASPFLVASTFGVMSGGLALLGIWVGSDLKSRSRERAMWLGGVLLILVAGFLCIKEVLF
jgi:putative Mn2+ efflux pump MntP